MKTLTDIDIDFADRDKALSNIQHIPAGMIQNGKLKKHNVGVYFHEIPTDPETGVASIPYDIAESRGYFKVDFLNVGIYEGVRDEQHLIELTNKEPIWEMLEDHNIVSGLFQISGHFELVNLLKPKSIEQLAMTIALIRPGKKHLIGKSWDEIEKEIWVKPDDDSYYFKKSHAFSYALALIVQMNLLVESVS